MKITAEPRSDQWNADDFVGSPRTFTIAGVKPGTAEQKYDIELVEGEGRSWRPPLTMLRLLLAAWGDDATEWVGRRVTLYRDETVRFGRDAVGGIRVSHMSNLPGGKPFEVKLTESRGRRAAVKVQPLKDEPAATGQTTLADRINAAVAAFGRGDVTVQQLEARVGSPREEWTEENLGRLNDLFQALKSGQVTKAEAFPEDGAS